MLMLNKKFSLSLSLSLSMSIDPSKAFDTLDHNIMLLKLRHYDVTGIELDFFTSYLLGICEASTTAGVKIYKVIHHHVHACNTRIHSPNQKLC